MANKETSLRVKEAMQEEAYKGIIRVDSQFMKEVGVRAGDIVEIEGGRKTVGIVDRAYPSDVGEAIIRMDGIVRRNAKTGIGEQVKIRKADVKEAKKITVAPSQQGIMIQADPGIFTKGLLGRVVVKGDIVALGGGRRRRSTFSGSPFEDIFEIFEQGFMGSIGSLKFIVAETTPTGTPIIITENTEIKVSPKAMQITEDELILPDVTYEDIGGLDEEIKKIREMVELPLRHPEIFQALGIDPPQGVLLHGSPGTGKTLLAKAVANESEANFILINGPEIMNKFYGESEKRIRKIFEEAAEKAPSIIFIDELDAIAPKREETHGEVERRVVAQLLAMMDGLNKRGNVVVIGATNRPNSIDPALRRPGRFDREIVIGVPDKKGRSDILKIHTRNMPLTKSVNIEEMAKITHGFVGADLQALAKEAAMNVLRRTLPDIKLREKQTIPKETLDKLKITDEDFKSALKIVRPSAMREVLVEKPNTKWEDIGGLDKLKTELHEVIEWPLKNQDAFERMGIKPPKGVLIYGPPGTGKTLLAKAVANESEANFINVKGPELVSMWVGESLPYNEELIVKKDGKIIRMKIGDIVENKEDIEVLTFDKDKRVGFSKIDDYIKHPLTSKLVEITTRTGRKIKVTTDHSLFSFVNGKFGSLPTSHLIPNESYIAIPKRLNLPKERMKNINLYEGFKNDDSVSIGKAKDYLIRAKLILGLEKTSEILGISKKYLADIISKNLPVSITAFDKLLREAKLRINYDEIKIKLKGSKHNYNPILEINSDFWRLVGIWVAEGDFNGYTVRIHNSNPEIREDILKIADKYGFSISKLENSFTINSLLIQKLFKNILGLEEGAENKRIPDIIFALDKEAKSNFLKGYFSGDGSIPKGEKGKFRLEAGTVSRELANDLMYLLLDFGIVAFLREKKERTESTTNQLIIFGVKNFENFKDIGFIDKSRNMKIGKYINSRKWTRSDLIPISGALLDLTTKNYNPKSNLTIGKERLKQMLVYADKDKSMYKEYWDLVEGDIFFDLVKEIKVIDNEDYVYDVSVPDGQNFVAGFGGIFAHNSEKGIRKIFEKARQASPTIIFFDEIDSIASRRGTDQGSKSTERMVNQLLSEMDGLEELHDVIVIGATNRPDMVDPALLRPGRFDRIIMTPVPDQKGREEIFKVHTKRMPISKQVDIKKLAEQTNNYVGSDIEAVCREAGMLALRNDIKAKEITAKDFKDALEKVKPSITDRDIKTYEEIEQRYIRTARGAAIREAHSYMG
ncbi:MAG: AAA family ATPase [Candidatus Woesearchaeota archaeon]